MIVRSDVRGLGDATASPGPSGGALVGAAIGTAAPLYIALKLVKSPFWKGFWFLVAAGAAASPFIAPKETAP